MNAVVNNIIGQQPPVTRCYLVVSTTLMVLCSLDLLSPFNLYLNWQLIFHQWQVWRLFTCFLFFGSFGWNFFWNWYVLWFYCANLEDMAFRNRPADFLWLLLCGAGMVLMFAYFFDTSLFMSGSMIDIMVYVWGRRNSHARLNVLFLTVRAPYLPYVLAFVALVMGASLQDQFNGIWAGHIYYFFEDVYPYMPTSGGFRLFKTPKLLRLVCGQKDDD